MLPKSDKEENAGKMEVSEETVIGLHISASMVVSWKQEEQGRTQEELILVSPTAHQNQGSQSW